VKPSAGMEDEQASFDRSKEPSTQARPLGAWHYCMLAIPFLGLLWPPLYSRWTPEVFGIPFFYAYQFIWIFLSAGSTAVVYRSISK
jgi:hypothetical protein